MTRPGKIPTGRSGIELRSAALGANALPLGQRSGGRSRRLNLWQRNHHVFVFIPATWQCTSGTDQQGGTGHRTRHLYLGSKPPYISFLPATCQCTSQTDQQGGTGHRTRHLYLGSKPPYISFLPATCQCTSQTDQQGGTGHRTRHLYLGLNHHLFLFPATCQGASQGKAGHGNRYLYLGTNPLSISYPR